MCARLICRARHWHGDQDVLLMCTAFENLSRKRCSVADCSHTYGLSWTLLLCPDCRPTATNIMHGWINQMHLHGATPVRIVCFVCPVCVAFLPATKHGLHVQAVSAVHCTAPYRMHLGHTQTDILHTCFVVI